MADPTSVPHAQRDRVVHHCLVDLASTEETILLAAGGPGTKHDLTSLVIANGGATKVTVDIRDEPGGVVRFSIRLLAGASIPIPLLVPHPQTKCENDWTIQVTTAAPEMLPLVSITAIAIKNLNHAG